MKIIATIGPKSLDKRVLQGLISNGVDILRLNCSHFNENEFDSIVEKAREVKKGIHIMVDLCGKKIRVSEKLNGAYKIYSGDIVYFCGEDEYEKIKHGNTIKEKIIPLNVKSKILASSKIKGISMKDNTMKFNIIGKNIGLIKTVVIDGGVVRSGKGCNVIGLNNDSRELSKRDKEGINWAIENNVNIICQSYVEIKDDIDKVVEYITEINKSNTTINVWAKVETEKGINNLEEISKKVDCIVIGRGDLVPEAGIIEAVKLENKAIKFAKENNKSIILATHILSSMKYNKEPNLTEIESIYTFVSIGVSGVLLAAETSVGQIPVEVVKVLKDILRNYESFLA